MFHYSVPLSEVLTKECTQLISTKIPNSVWHADQRQVFFHFLIVSCRFPCSRSYASFIALNRDIILYVEFQIVKIKSCRWEYCYNGFLEDVNGFYFITRVKEDIWLQYEVLTIRRWRLYKRFIIILSRMHVTIMFLAWSQGKKPIWSKIFFFNLKEWYMLVMKEYRAMNLQG